MSDGNRNRLKSINKKNFTPLNLLFLFSCYLYIFQDSFINEYRVLGFGGLTHANVSLLIYFCIVIIYTILYNNFSIGFDNSFLMLLLICTPSFALLGFSFFNVTFDGSSYFTGYINFIILMLTCILTLNLFYRFNDAEFVFEIYIWMLLVIAAIMYLQFFGIIEFKTARTRVPYNIEVAFIGKIIRGTSIFSEPSALAFYYAIGIVIALYLDMYKIMWFFIISTLFTLSLTAYLFIFIFLVVYNYKVLPSFRKNKIVLLLLICLMVLIFSSTLFQSLFALIESRISAGGFGSYRTEAPILGMKYIFERPMQFLFGAGIGQIESITKSFDLLEYAATTHNFVVDIIMELGFFAACIFFIFFVIKLNRDYRLLIMVLSLLMMGVGYRSPRFLFIILIIYLIPKIREK